MLEEAQNVRQIKGDPRRRWFADEYFDLIVWFDKDDSVWGFQLCYDRGDKPRALTWTRDHGYKHAGIDDGEPAGGSYKSSPVLVADGLFNAQSVGERLKTNTGDLPPGLAAFILDKVRAVKL